MKAGWLGYCMNYATSRVSLKGLRFIRRKTVKLSLSLFLRYFFYSVYSRAIGLANVLRVTLCCFLDLSSKSYTLRLFGFFFVFFSFSKQNPTRFPFYSIIIYFVLLYPPHHTHTLQICVGILVSWMSGYSR